MRKIYGFLLFALFAVLIFSASVSAQKGTNVEKTIVFARGKSSATVRGFIADRLTTHEYKIDAREGQTMTVLFSSPRKDVDVCVTTPLPGTPSDVCGKRRYVKTLPIDGVYLITIDSKRENTSYTLTVSIK